MKCRDCENLIWSYAEGERIWQCRERYCPDLDIERDCPDFAPQKPDIFTALSTLQDENEKLREKIEDARLEGYAKGLGEMSEENEKLREELEKVKEDWSTAVNGLVLMQKKLNKVYRMLYDPLIIVDGGHLRPVKNTSRQQVYKKLVDLQVEMGINRGFPWGEMRMEKKED